MAYTNMLHSLPVDLTLEILSFLNVDIHYSTADRHHDNNNHHSRHHDDNGGSTLSSSSPRQQRCSTHRFTQHSFIKLAFGYFNSSSSTHHHHHHYTNVDDNVDVVVDIEPSSFAASATNTTTPTKRRRIFQIFHHFQWHRTQLHDREITLWRELLQKSNVSSVRFLFISNRQLKRLFRRNVRVRRSSSSNGNVDISYNDDNNDNDDDGKLVPYAKLKRLEIGHFTDSGDFSGLLRMSEQCGRSLMHLSVRGFFMGSQSDHHHHTAANGLVSHDGGTGSVENDGGTGHIDDLWNGRDLSFSRRRGNVFDDERLDVVVNDGADIDDDDNDEINGGYEGSRALMKGDFVSSVKRMVSNLPRLRSLHISRDWVGSLGIHEDEEEEIQGMGAQVDSIITRATNNGHGRDYEEWGSPSIASSCSSLSSLSSSISSSPTALQSSQPLKSVLAGFHCFQHSQHLKRLVLNGMFPSADVNSSFNVLELVSSLAQYCPRLVELELQRASFAPMMFSSFMRILSRMPRLRKLNLDQCSVDDRMVKSLCKIQQQELRRYKLAASSHSRNSDNISHDFNGERRSKTNDGERMEDQSDHAAPVGISELSLRNNMIGKWGFWHLLHCGQLRSLDLSHNSLLVLQKGSLQQILLPTVNTRMSKLVLRMTDSVTCRIEDEQAKVLFSLRFLRHLDLSGNAIRGSLPDTFHPLKSNTVLEHLNLSNNSIANEHARFLVHECCPNLQHLNLNHNCITDIDLLHYAHNECAGVIRRIPHIEIEENDFEVNVDLSMLFS